MKKDQLRNIFWPTLVGLLYFCGATSAIMLTRGDDGMAMLWPSNGLLLAVCLRAPPAHVGRYLGCASVASFLANLVGRTELAASVDFTLANMVCVLLCVTVLRRLCPRGLRLDSPYDVGCFCFAAVTGACASTLIASMGLNLGAGGFSPWMSWFVTDLLGTLIVTPLVLIGLALVGGELAVRIDRSRTEVAAVLGGFLFVTAAVFAQSSFPLLFLPLSALLVVTYRLGVFGAAIGDVLIALVGSIFTSFGSGPISLIRSGRDTGVLFMQFYLAVVFVSALPLATLLAARQRLTRRIEQSERIHRGLIERSRAVIFEIDVQGRWTFLSPAWTALTGVRTDAALGVSYADLVHPDDRLPAGDRLAPLFAGEIEECRQELRYRATDGEYRWATLRCHAIRDASGAIIGAGGSISDISARVAAARALADSERRYRLLAKNSNDMIVRLGLDGVRRYVSPASRSLLGHDPEDLVGHSPAGDIHPDDRARVADVRTALLKGTGEPMCVYRQRRKDGSYAWLEATYRLIHDPRTQAPQEFIASVRDVSRRQAAELAVTEAMARTHESHRLLTMAEAMAHVGHWRLDLVQKSLFWSAEVYKIHGVGPDYVPSLERAIDTYHPDDRARVAALVEQAIDCGRDFEFSARLCRPNGDVRHVVSRGQVECAPNGVVTGLFGVFQDVTQQAATEAALRDREARYRLLAENATDIIFRLGRDGRFVYVSPAVEALTGFAPEALLGQDPVAAVHPEDLPRVEEALEALWLGCATQIVVAYRTRCADGRWQWLEANGRLTTNDGVHEIVGVSRDVSDRKRFEAELLTAREAAEAAAREARQLSETDELTGLANRRMFLRQLDLEIDAARASHRALSVGVFDIDHFKMVNDRHGHAVGDDVLKRVAAVAGAAVRHGDLVGRLGGEEFGVLMFGADLEVAGSVGEHLRAAMEADSSPDAAHPLVTISVGVARLEDASTASTLLAAADAALYQAKRSGRNRLCLAA